MRWCHHCTLGITLNLPCLFFVDFFGTLEAEELKPMGLRPEDIKPAGQIVEEMVQGAVEQLQTAPWDVSHFYFFRVCFEPRMKCFTSLNLTFA